MLVAKNSMNTIAKSPKKQFRMIRLLILLIDHRRQCAGIDPNQTTSQISPSNALPGGQPKISESVATLTASVFSLGPPPCLGEPGYQHSDARSITASAATS